MFPKMLKNRERALALSFFAVCLLGVTGCSDRGTPDTQIKTERNSTTLSSLSDLSIEALRNRQYGGELKIESRLDSPCADTGSVKSLPDANGTYQSYMASYISDGLRVYSRINIPDGDAPEGGFPLIIFAHGWVGAAAAPTYTLGCDFGSMYSENTDAYARAGYVVFIPGYRGHATVNGELAEGIEFVEDWDNGTYLSTQFYAIDVLNLMAGLQASGTLESDILPKSVNYQTDAFNLAGHSQGGDVALTVLAATGENAKNGLEIEKASIWSGGFADRLTLMQTYHPIEKTTESFMSGDGDWTGSAKGQSGAINPNFIFAYPPDWIETPDPFTWTWQKDEWSFPSVKAVLEDSLPKTYKTINGKVADISGAKFAVNEDSAGKVVISHAPEVVDGMDKIGGFNFAKYVSEPLILHFPDRDHISLPAWNYDLCQRVNTSGGDCTPFEYPENNHGMRLSKYDWFSSEGAVDGYAPMVARDVLFFGGGDPKSVLFPGE